MCKSDKALQHLCLHCMKMNWCTTARMPQKNQANTHMSRLNELRARRCAWAVRGGRHLTHRQPSSHLKYPPDPLAALHQLQREHKLSTLSLAVRTSSLTAAALCSGQECLLHQQRVQTKFCHSPHRGLSLFLQCCPGREASVAVSCLRQVAAAADECAMVCKDLRHLWPCLFSHRLACLASSTAVD